MWYIYFVVFWYLFHHFGTLSQERSGNLAKQVSTTYIHLILLYSMLEVTRSYGVPLGRQYKLGFSAKSNSHLESI
jgi:hypothetical protein